MKKVLVLVILSLGFASASFAEVKEQPAKPENVTKCEDFNNKEACNFWGTMKPHQCSWNDKANQCSGTY